MESFAVRNSFAKRSIWIVLITAATILGSFVFACATPFAALGALAARHMSRRDALALIGLNWLAGQIIGYGLLHYPQTWDSFAWGGAIGLSALAATAVAMRAGSLSRHSRPLLSNSIIFVAAFAAYESLIYAAAWVLPAESSSFTPRILFYIFAVNAGAFIGLLFLQRVGEVVHLSVPRQPALT